MALKYLPQELVLQTLCRYLHFPGSPWAVLSALLAFLGTGSAGCSVSSGFVLLLRSAQSLFSFLSENTCCDGNAGTLAACRRTLGP